MAQPDLTLFYSPKACSLASHILLEESGLAFAPVAVNIRAGDNRSPEYLRLNPKGTVPALRVGQTIVTESPAILAYIADLVPQRGLLPPVGTLQRAVAQEWLNAASGSLHGAYRAIFRPQHYAGDQEDAVRAVRARGQALLHEALLRVERSLEGRPYALGEAFSAVDPYLLVFYLWSQDERVDSALLPSLPRYRALAERLWQRPSVHAAIRREREVRRYDLPDFLEVDA
ncbi:glutathione S-transferase family protein [Pseudomonas aeruginosa]|uniref:glutathione S-transferase family protein n=1 Tax=Pseudomonas aeruginosa TaxID=287 RepID=UPI001F224C03|nr:glutathione S-transferase N-terminal domain-containing protein [Pseudomonas aeruginosa]UGW98298.1 glutathione S-transferase N-terminal domain-containing protein [Pseudomonas aeruginosa]HEP8707281.1 glutathione S-transferase N-terminal domain-containing protein [Pseudomonas aeruginosa]HEP8709647.1 glutathione S-transferase N-terminal domain-containing protein [Pseudomonas aeruginosa]